jgi:anti-anti-sigma factor
MNYEFQRSDEFLIVKLSGTPVVNDRLSARQYLAPYLQPTCSRIIIDLGEMKDVKAFYIVVGILNTMKKEFQLSGGKIKLCALNPAFHRYIQANRLDQIFDIGQSLEQVKLCFEGESRDGYH